ncbi:unnamed protein product [Menidia menidia]|uniref:RNA helicase n=1 Tax=Menidia menidia TaxID=238744 RepID=A0A8S4AJ38_9TELE|nr:unnamed protein product [Menidia menidia]
MRRCVGARVSSQKRVHLAGRKRSKRAGQGSLRCFLYETGIMFGAPGASQKAGKDQDLASGRPRQGSGLREIHIDEEVKIAVNLSLERFRYSDQKEIEFPASFSSTERAFVHRMAQSLGYISKSKGKGPSRYLTVRKKDVADKPHPNISLTLSPSSQYFIRSLVQRFPTSKKERTDMQPSSKSSSSLAADPDSSYDRNRASGRLNNGIPMVPKRRAPSELDAFRCSLPVCEHQEDIIQLIRDNRVVLVVGETGSGKTTQIPQFLLDDYFRNRQSCRIFCTQPRRLAAIAVAERVAAERGECVGQTVGYHIRLESRVSPKTLLTFCTSGVLLRTLMAGDASLTTVTHIIVDEVHERDGLTDFLLTKMQDVLQKVPTLKLILSSAALDVELFRQYFGSCPVIHLKGRLFEVKDVFLEDILRLTGFNNRDLWKYKEETQRKERKQKRLTEWCETVETSSPVREPSPVLAPGFLQASSCGGRDDRDSNKLDNKGPESLEPWLLKEMDACISNIFLYEDQDTFNQLFNLILNENVNVDYMHSETGATALMVSAGRGFLSQMQQLLVMGADISTVASNGCAVQILKTIDALDPFEDLTDLGYHLADLPVEPHLGKMVLCAVVLKCLDPILTIACTLAYRDPFVLPSMSAQKRAALSCRKRFTSNTFSDHMALLRAFQAWQKARSDGWERSFCEKNFLSQATMDMILGMRTQLLGQLRAIGFVRARGGSDIRDVNLNSENWAVVKAALVAGMYPNLAHINKESSLLSSYREKKIHFHPTSILSQLKESTQPKSAQALPTDWLIYDEMSRGHRMASVRCCSLVTSITIAIFGGSSKLPCPALLDGGPQRTNDSPPDDTSDSDSEDLAEMRIDDWLVFQLEKEGAALLFELRQKWQNLFTKRIRCPSKPWSQRDESIIQTLVSVLGAEEQEAGLLQPTGIGQRPRPMSSEEGPRSSGRGSRSSLQIPTNSSSDNSSCSVAVDSPRDPPCPPSSGKVLKPASLQAASSSVRYFIMKSSNIRNIEISQQKGIWSTTPINETKLTKAFLGNGLIILIFSVQGSGHFQGYARMTSVISQEGCHDWGFVGLGGLFSVEWIHKESLSFQCTQHILNPWNDNKRVQISRDGQELEPLAGSQLLALWERASGGLLT